MYAFSLHLAVQVLENRLFSEGLHVLGAPPSRYELGHPVYELKVWATLDLAVL
jgi:cobalamin biosynthesis Mg chelatase CobN